MKIIRMKCKNCSARIDRALNEIDGVWAKANYKNGIVKLLLQENAFVMKSKIISSVTDAGYDVVYFELE